MRSVETVTPDGNRWVVRRRWLPWDVRWRGRRRRRSRGEEDGFDWLDLAEPLFWFDEGFGFALALGVILLLVILLLFLVPVLALVLEVLLVVVLAALILGFRVLFRRPWVVHAIPDDPGDTPITWKVIGFRRSGEAVEEIARQLAAGVGVPSLPFAAPVPAHPNHGNV